MVLIALVGLAHAEGLVWRWEPGTTYRYHAEALVQIPGNVLLMHAERNLEARVGQLGIAADLSCVSTAKKKGWEVSCTMEKVGLEGLAVNGEGDNLKAIIAENNAKLNGSRLTMEVAPDGRIKEVDLPDWDRRDQRHKLILEEVRMLVSRVVIPLGMQTPSDDAGQGGWKHTGAYPGFTLFDRGGSTGGSFYRYELGGPAVNGTVGVLGSGTAAQSTSNQLERNVGAAVSLVTSAQFRFDSSAGMLAWGTVTVTGEATNSNPLAQLKYQYGYAGWIGRINADGSIEGIGGPSPIPSSPSPAPTPAPADTVPPAVPPVVPPAVAPASGGAR